MNRAQSYASALPSPPYLVVTPYILPTDGGATISWQARTCRKPITNFNVVVQPGNFVFNFPGTTTSTTFTGLQNGTSYTFTVTATNPDGTDTQTTTFIPSPPCTNPTMTATPASGATGSPVNFSAAASSCTNPTYRFWTQAPGARWQISRDYSNASTFTWKGSGLPGLFNTEVDVRQQTSSVVYDKVFNLPYQINPCTGATLTANPWSPQPPGTAITLTGAAKCPGPPEYRFWTQAPGGNWGIVQDYSPTATYNWNTTNLPLGSYGMEVDVRDRGATDVYETVANLTFTLGPAECHNPTLTANPATVATGSPVAFTATSTGCPNPRYRFWIAPPNGAWSIVQDYSPASTFNWPGTGVAGTYRFEVDVRDNLSSNTYDAVKNVTYAVTGCTAAKLVTDKASPQLPGAAIVLTGSATCPGTPEYRFWLRTPNGAWSIVQDYSPTPTFNWNTSGKPTGAYGLEVDVRDHGATDVYETVANMNFTLAACISTTLTTDKSSPQTAGTTIVLTGSATCTGTPQYRFWVRPPGGAWGIARDYSATATFSWTTTGNPAGIYGLEVDVLNAGSIEAYDSVANIPFALN
jgi:hypothetical protein